MADLKETQFTATGPASVGFQTEPETSTEFQIGVDASGLVIGVSGTGILVEQPNSGATGVQGNGNGVGWGVAGFGGNVTPGTGSVEASACAGVFGTGGSQTAQGPQAIGAPGVFGIGGVNSGIGVYGQGTGPGEQGEPGGPGVKGIGGAILSTDNADGVQGFARGAFSGVSGFGGNNSGTGVFGLGGGPGGPGVRGYGVGATLTPPSAPVGVYGQAGPNADGVQGFATGAFSGVSGFGGADSGTGVFGLGGGPGGPGVRGFAAGATLTPPSGPVGVYGQGGPNGDGVVGEGNVGIAGNGSNIGVLGQTGSDGIAVYGLSDPGGSAAQFGGPVMVEGDFSAQVLSVTSEEVTVQGNFSVLSPGIKSAVVPFPDGSHRQLYCMESPESWFEDFGFGRLTDGRARIELDPDFAATVDTDGYHVFITEYDANNGLFVANRTNTGFEVHATNPAIRSEFSYRVVARRKDVAPARLAKVTVPTESREAALRKENWEKIKASLAKRR